ncbi:MAG: GMC family oxidoreductase N-terminal domain-containing protein [Rubellimicrobium sp.]|nr:GMC family oxidoreductase N-terminal domain-containing protein [Rubellimicrobium sp.]
MDGEFDHVIVGAGSAGSALAWRLSEDPRLRILVLEAGGSDRRLFVQMPLGYGKLFYDPAVNWMYRAEPDPGLGGTADHWPRGRILGGSSAINAMVWVRGHPGDYDDWREAGAAGWGWDDVLPDFRALEDNEAGADAWRGRGGPLFISSNRGLVHPLVEPWIAACEALGIPRNPDFNGARQEGAGIYQMTIRGGRRNSAARAFLRPAMRRGNVTVLTGAQAMRVLIEDGQARGVEYRRRGRVQVVRAGNVILAGGAVNSPQLLMLSGIGPGADLQALGLPVVIDNPHVGRHLRDHQGLNYTWRMKVPTLNDTLGSWVGRMTAGARWLLTGGGPLSLSINHGGGFFRTDPAMARPNMQLYMQAFSTLIPRDGERPVLNPDPWSGFSIGLSNCRPRAEGAITLTSPDPFAPPRITVNAYSHDADVAEMLSAVKMLRRIAATAPLAALIAEELRPGPAVQADADLIADFRARSGTVYHPSCSARMGADRGTSVVDPRLRVHGVGRLMVADASVFPTLPGGNTNAPAILTGWRAGGFLRDGA